MYIASANSSTNAMNPPSAASGTASRSCASVPPAAVSIIASTPTNRPARENTRRHDFIEVRSFSLLRDVVLGIPGIGSRCVSGERRRTRFCDSPAPETQIVALTRGTAAYVSNLGVHRRPVKTFAVPPSLLANGVFGERQPLLV